MKIKFGVDISWHESSLPAAGMRTHRYLILLTPLFSHEYEVIFRSHSTDSKICKSEITRTVLNSIVPNLIRPFNEMLNHLPGHSPLLVEPSLHPKFPVKALNPFAIGIDLVADAIAAFIRYNKPFMVIDFGTALTFTTISKTSEIPGVAIAPGLSIALKSLTGNTAQLSDIQLVSPLSVLGRIPFMPFMRALFLDLPVWLIRL